MGIRLLDRADTWKWDRYVLGSVASSCYHLSGWREVIERSFGHKTFYLMSVREGGEIDGILPIVQLKSVIFGNFMVSMPYFNYGGICADNAGAHEALLKEAVRLAFEVGASHMELRHSSPEENGLHVKKAKVSMRLQLPANPEELWKSLQSKLRSQIRRPEKEGMYARFGRQGELDAFYKVFSTNMRDLGTPVYSRRFFERILDAFPDAVRICTVYTKSGEPAASGFLVRFRDTLEIPWASSLRDFNRFSPNSLLYWSVLKFACESGCGVFDFGRSSPVESTYKFKEQWGAYPRQLYWYYWLKNGDVLPEFNPKNPKYGMAIKIWKKLPLGLTRLIGPKIVKNLP